MQVVQFQETKPLNHISNYYSNPNMPQAIRTITDLRFKQPSFMLRHNCLNTPRSSTDKLLSYLYTAVKIQTINAYTTQQACSWHMNLKLNKGAN